MNSHTGAQQALNAIAVKVEASSGNVPALLHEIRHALALLLDGGTTTVIDLKRIPLAPGEEEQIIHCLGSGEVRAELHALGRSEFAETAIAGVWLVSHYDNEEHVTARFIEVTRIPEMLCSQPADMLNGLEKLNTYLAANRMEP